jgi:hypothetical protein
MRGLDSILPVDPVAANAQGFCAIGRYLPIPGAGNGITPSELESYTANDFGCWVVCELDPNAPSDLGAAGGRQYGTWAVEAADALAIPKGIPLRASNDAVVSNWDNLHLFFEAYAGIVLSSPYLPSLYGQSAVWEAVKGYGFIDFWHAPDGTEPPWPEGTSIAQNPSGQVVIDGARYDTDDILMSTFGAFTLDGLWSAIDPMGESDVLVRTLYNGDAGYDVAGLQAALNWRVAKGRIPGATQQIAVDGIYGPETMALLGAFRTHEAMNNPIDGHCGGDTWRRVFDPTPFG